MPRQTAQDDGRSSTSANKEIKMMRVRSELHKDNVKRPIGEYDGTPRTRAELEKSRSPAHYELL
jgi:hypothetical protein